MALQLSVTVRNARLDAIESAIGSAPVMKIRSGAAPVNCAAGDSGTVLATLALPSDWMAPASGGAKALAGIWSEVSADNSGTAGHFRIYDSGGATCHIQGTASATGGGGDLQLTSTTITAGDTITITSATFTDGNA